MPELGSDELSLNIDKMILGFSDTTSTPSICRVTDCLRSTKDKAYDPMIIAIGPFHRGKAHLKAMEHHKMRYLKQLLGYFSANIYVNAVKNLERAARNFYAEEIKLDADEFVTMLLLDGIFIIEFSREYKVYRDVEQSEGNPIFGFQHVVCDICRDLMLFENQIPMFVVEALFQLSNHDKKEFSHLLWPVLFHTEVDVPNTLPKADHLLGLVHSVECNSFAQILSHKKDTSFKMDNIHSATELKEAGIAFKKAKNENMAKNENIAFKKAKNEDIAFKKVKNEDIAFKKAKNEDIAFKKAKNENENCSWLDIKFENKTIYIPELSIGDETESWFRNMIAYEYYLPRSSPKYVSDYAFFLHCLMSSSKDAELLRRCGAISNWLGGDARVYEMIDKLGTHVFTSEKFSYLGVFRSINDHCRHKRNTWLAVLRRHHFNNPWTVISLVAAAVLLSVSVVQTVFTLLTFYRE